MTLVIALKWPTPEGDAASMVSDTRATTSVGKQQMEGILELLVGRVIRRWSSGASR